MHSKSSSALGQLLLVGIPGPELDPEIADALRAVQPGGYILFTRNIHSASQLRKLTDQLRDLSLSEPIICIDQEGGRVSRLKAIGEEPPSASQLRDANQETFVKRHGKLTAQLLRLFGFNLNLCPVLDICLNGNEDTTNSLRGRCYGVDPQQVVRLSSIFAEEMQRNGVLTCGKHFPGYTHAPNDVHHDLPVIERSREELDQLELIPFRELITKELLDSIMVGHACYPQLQGLSNSENAQPITAAFSNEVIQILRAELGFNGLVMTDDLDMGAIYHHHPLAQALELSFKAGNHLAMICHRVRADEIQYAYQSLEKISAKWLDNALHEVSKFKQKLKSCQPTAFNESLHAAINKEIMALRIDVLGEEEAAKRSVEDGARSPVEIY